MNVCILHQKCVPHEQGYLANRVSALIKEILESSFAFLFVSEMKATCKPESELSQTFRLLEFSSWLSSVFSLQNCEKQICCLLATNFMVFFYYSPDILRHLQFAEFQTLILRANCQPNMLIADVTLQNVIWKSQSSLW